MWIMVINLVANLKELFLGSEKQNKNKNKMNSLLSPKPEDC